MGIIEFGDNNTPLTSIFSGKLGPTGSSDAILFFNVGGLFEGTTIMAMSTTGPNNEGVPTGPVGPNIALGGPMYPPTDAAYNLGATGYQLNDVHFSGSLFNNGVPFQGGVSGLTYRATGPTGPTGGPTGPYSQPTLQTAAHILPTTDLTFDLGATGIRFRDIYVGGTSIYMGDSVVLKASATDFSATTQAGVTSLASATYVPPPPPASAFTPLGAATDENKIQPSFYPMTFSLMATSADGRYITIPGPPDGFGFTSTMIRVSSDSGASFTGDQTGVSGTAVPSAVAVSQSGRYQIIVENDQSDDGYGGIFVSSNYGSSWDETYLDGDGTADFTTCAVSETSPSSNPIFVAAGVISAVLPSPPSQPAFMFRRGVPTNKASWTVVSQYSTAIDFVGITSVAISNDGTRLVVLDTAGGTKVAVFYEITSVAVTYRTHIDLSTIDSFTVENHKITNLTSTGFTLMAQTAGTGDFINAFQFSWPNAAATPAYIVDSVKRIDSNISGSVVPSQIIASANGTYQIAICLDVFYPENPSTNTYISSNSGSTWSLILQNSESPFNSLATIAMSADASRTYCLGRENGNMFKQALRTSLSVGSYVQGGPTTALTYRATGPTGPTGGATGPRAPTTQIASHLLPTTDATYDLGATGIQFKDVHFSGSLYNNGVPFSGGGGGPSGLLYLPTGPTGPTGGPTGPNPDPTLEISTHLVPN
jgi:hypothetical protein